MESNWETENKKQRVIRGRFSLKSFLIILILCVIAFSFIAYNKHINKEEIEPAFIVLFFAFPLAILGFFSGVSSLDKIIITENEIIYSETVWQKDKSIIIGSITKIKTTIDLNRRGLSLNLYNSEQFAVTPFTIYMNSFRKEDYISLLKTIKNKINTVETDDLTRKMEKGDFSDVYGLAGKIVVKEFSKKI